jgi:hypothetical protein
MPATWEDLYSCKYYVKNAQNTCVLNQDSQPVALNLKKKKKTAGHWWFTPIILATQEAEIRRITVRNQPEKYSSRDPISKKKNPS